MIAGKLEEGACGWNCSVDGHTISAFPQFKDQVTNYIACDSAETLEVGQHTLNVNFYFPSKITSTLWLDSIQYQPLPSDPLDSVMFRIHNSDPSIDYSNSSGEWFWQEAQTNATDRIGANMGFAFNGSSVTLYTLVLTSNGTEPLNAAKGFHFLDGNSNSTLFELPGSIKIRILHHCTKLPSLHRTQPLHVTA
ncbi:hypothetical protein BDP27DRAFT_1369327 [Rhodocollybia butyracea]|uniref:Uncharacterized protein n=1 Tax=Rhodocollybia butyracea TaxID=206335 RepID=A0A9P5PED0_9AGAR|nr:hypothetical protein BDP27DRAFT_1369327 [Rhodocollybia butyracea]